MCDAAGAEAWSYDIVSGKGWKLVRIFPVTTNQAFAGGASSLWRTRYRIVIGPSFFDGYAAT